MKSDNKFVLEDTITELMEIISRLSVFRKLYDILRLVDPVNKKTILVKDDIVKVEEGSCYEFWKRETFCENCISMRAYTERDTCVKIEINDDRVLLIIASPININGGEYIVEMLKDISKGAHIFKDKQDIKNVSEILDTLNNKVIKDELTGIYNKRYINERLPVDINTSIDNGQPLSIIMADIDMFKKINDTHGHVIGDKILKDIAELIISSTRTSTDWSGRYGGEEFLIILNNTNAENAYKVAEKIRNALENTIFEYGDIRINVTSSFGVYEVESGLNFEEAIACADEKMYEAKKAGRNKTVK